MASPKGAAESSRSVHKSAEQKAHPFPSPALPARSALPRLLLLAVHLPARRSRVRRHGKQRWLRVNAEDSACARGQGIVSHQTGRALISGGGEERIRGSRRCDLLPERRGAAGLRPGLSSGRWVRVPGGELRSHPRWWAHTMKPTAAFPARSAAVAELETPHGLPFSVHLGVFCCWR